VSQRSFVEVERRLGEDGDVVSGIGDGGSWGVIILKERSRLWNDLKRKTKLIN
jgi:hypothetical protein